MKKLIVPSLLLLAVISCDVRKHDRIAGNEPLKTQVEIKDPTTVKIIDSAYDFGTANDGDIVSYSFRFVNSGTKPLIITNASASCGCTVPEKPEAPIAPGDTGYLKVKFDSKNRAGKVHKTIYVSANTEPAFPDLFLTGEVMAKKED